MPGNSSTGPVGESGMSNSQSIPSSFNPHAIHPFTAGASPPSSQLHPSTGRAPAPPQTGQKKSTYGSATPNMAFPAVQSPQPRPASKWPPQTTGSQPIFTPFKLERPSPELPDVLAKKKNGASWPAKPKSVAEGTGGGANVGKK
ncbi:hypothetical protein K439DRAFT_1637983 [Ramaria rubella]|nr:hypothetical protein K439DRAFT_1637983 [Ramaria rubella]